MLSMLGAALPRTVTSPGLVCRPTYLLLPCAHPLLPHLPYLPAPTCCRPIGGHARFGRPPFPGVGASHCTPQPAHAARTLFAAHPCSYVGYVMLSTAAPGLPVWQTPPETWQTVLNESFNFFYVNIGLAQLGLNPVPCVAEHPVRWGQAGCGTRGVRVCLPASRALRPRAWRRKRDAGGPAAPGPQALLLSGSFPTLRSCCSEALFNFVNAWSLMFW